jgi:putative hydrolase of the HAD superfamily
MSAMIDAGLKIEKEEGLRILFELYDEYGIEYKKIFQEFLKKTIGEVDWKILANGIVAYRKIKAGFLIPYPHVHSTLLDLKMKGVKLAIVTDAPRLRAWLRLAGMKLTDFFDVVVTHDDTGELKPHALPFETALKELDVQPKDVIMVGDWIERDIEGAKQLGIKTCFARYGAVNHPEGKDSGADYEIDDIKQLLKLV